LHIPSSSLHIISMEYVWNRYSLARRRSHKDIDRKSLQYARKNVDLNNFASRIQLLETVSEGPLLPSELFASGRYLRFQVMTDIDWISVCAIHRSMKMPINCIGMLDKNHLNHSLYRPITT